MIEHTRPPRLDHGRAVCRTLLAALVVAVFLDPSAVAARPRAQDPTVPHRIAVGAPAGFWPMYRGDGARSGRVKVPLPTNPVVERRLTLFADLATSPVVDPQGHLVVATKDGKLVELLPSGGVAFTLVLEAPVVLGPVIESNGTRLVVTREGVAIGVSVDGTPIFATPLATSRSPTFAEPLATRDGAAIVALGSRVTKIGADGSIRATADLDEAVAAIAETERAIYLSTETGRVVEWLPPENPRPLGNLGGKPTGALIALGGERLLAAVRGASLVEFGVLDGARTTLVNLAPDSVADSPAQIAGGELRFTTRGGWLLGYVGTRETFRRSTTPSASLPAFAFSEAVLPPLADPVGNVAFVTPAAIVGIALPSGDVHSVVIPECGPPVAIVPAGVRALAVFCRSGLVAFVADAAGAQNRSEKPTTKQPASPRLP